ncbi:hypothetical protein [Desulfonatronum parangueonense]
MVWSDDFAGVFSWEQAGLRLGQVEVEVGERIALALQKADSICITSIFRYLLVIACCAYQSRSSGIFNLSSKAMW